MPAEWRVWSALILFAAGIVWMGIVAIIRGRSLEASARLFWLSLTAPFVCIVCQLVALWLIVTR